jgi:hypothetical protein
VLGQTTFRLVERCRQLYNNNDNNNKNANIKQHIKCQNKLDVSIKIKTTIMLAYVNKVWTTFREDKLKCKEKWIPKKDQRERQTAQKLREREREIERDKEKKKE